MSRTDAHSPFVVRMGHGDLLAVEHHDHRDGRVCDLPPRDSLASRSWRTTTFRGCYWDFKYDGQQVCGCNMCTAQEERKVERRRDRKRARRVLRRWTEDE